MSEGKRTGPWSGDPAAERAELERRAQVLARPRDTGTSRERQLAVFERHGTRYAIDPRYVFEVARAPRPTALPRSDRHWLGVTSLHGELMAVAELTALLGNGGNARAPVEHDGDAQLLLVLGEQTRELGLAIDSVLEPLALSGALAEPPRLDASASLIEGITEDGLRVVRGDLLLSDPRLFVESPSTAS